MPAWSSPTMTGGSTPEPYVVTARGSQGTNYPWKAMDGSTTYWQSEYAEVDVNFWWQIYVGFPTVVTGFTIQFPSTTYMINAYLFQGSNNGTDWTTLNSGAFAVNTSVQSKTVTNSTAYLYYRLYVDYLETGELEVRVREITMSGTRDDVFGCNFVAPTPLVESVFEEGPQMAATIYDAPLSVIAGTCDNPIQVSGSFVAPVAVISTPQSFDGSISGIAPQIIGTCANPIVSYGRIKVSAATIDSVAETDIILTGRYLQPPARIDSDFGSFSGVIAPSPQVASIADNPIAISCSFASPSPLLSGSAANPEIITSAYSAPCPTVSAGMIQGISATASIVAGCGEISSGLAQDFYMACSIKSKVAVRGVFAVPDESQPISYNRGC